MESRISSINSHPTQTVDDRYFATMRIPVVAGRVFQRLGRQLDGDVIISRRAASTIWNDSGGSAVRQAESIE